MTPTNSPAKAAASQATPLAKSIRLVDALRDPACYGHPVADFKLVETHSSWVILTGEHVYKIKKPVDLGFLDYTTLERRRAACEEELRLNRLLAPEIYIDVVAITGTSSEPLVDGPGPAIEYAVHMHQFDRNCQLDRLLADGALGQTDMIATARAIAAFHAATPKVAPRQMFGHAEDVHAAMRDNFLVIQRVLAGRRASELARLRDWAEAEYQACRDHIERRRDDGWVRECHGDLHLANLTRYRGKILAFDRIEFNPAFRWLDVMNDAAFLIMDLLFHGRRDLAFGFLNEYLQHTGDYAGLDLLRYYLVYRALVRAKVALLRASQIREAAGKSEAESDADRHLDLAISVSHKEPVRLIVMHGLSGSGKSWLSERLMTALPAIRLRSDVERKRLFGLDAMSQSLSGLGSDLYDEMATRRTYDRLAELAQRLFQDSYSVIVDATFLHTWQRQQFIELANGLNVAWAIVDCTAATGELHDRVAKRLASAGDVSEAGLAVLERQMESADPLDDSELQRTLHLDTGQMTDTDAMVTRINRILEQ